MFSSTFWCVNSISKPFEAVGDGGQKYTADSIIISTGAQARWLNIESEQKFRGFGVSACATCDGFFFKDKTVAVVGGGNAAVEEAMFLTKFASKVQLIHRRDSLRAEKLLQQKLMENKKIEIIWDTVIEEVIGDKKPKNVTGLKIKNVKTNKTKELKIDGLFIAIGHDPATELFKNQLEMDNEGYLITKPDSTATNIPGIYAAGDVKDKKTYKKVSDLTGKDLSNAYVRVEVICDREGFWLKPHCDIKEKLLSSLLFVNKFNESEELGTDFYNENLTKVKTIPYRHNYGYFFSSGPNTWHGMEKKVIKRERRSLLVNYVTFKTDWPVSN